MEILIDFLNLRDVDQRAGKSFVAGNGCGKYAGHGFHAGKEAPDGVGPAHAALPILVKAVFGRAARENAGCFEILKARAVQRRPGVGLYHAVGIQHQYAASAVGAGLLRQTQKRRCVHSVERLPKLLRQRFGEALILLDALIKQIFAHQLKQRNAHDGEGDADNQQIGDGESPADGGQFGFNPCQ